MPLLTAPQAADLLGVSGQTLRLWRNAGRGPAFVTLDPDRHARLRRGQGRSLVRYRLEDIEEWQQTTPAVDRRVPQRHRAPDVSPTLTGRQWAVVRAALVWEGRMDRLRGNIDLEAAKGQLETILAISVRTRTADASALLHKSLETRTEVLGAWVDHGWLEVAFRALAGDPDFPFVMIRQVLILPHQRKHAKWHPGPMDAIAIRTEFMGPLPSAIRPPRFKDTADLPPAGRPDGDHCPQPFGDVAATTGVTAIASAHTTKYRRDQQRRLFGKKQTIATALLKYPV